MATPLYLTMADIGRLYRVHESTARRWAREDSWRRTTTRPIRYHADDAQASYDKRHGENRDAKRVSDHLMRRYSAAASLRPAAAKVTTRPERQVTGLVLAQGDTVRTV